MSLPHLGGRALELVLAAVGQVDIFFIFEVRLPRLFWAFEGLYLVEFSLLKLHREGLLAAAVSCLFGRIIALDAAVVDYFGLNVVYLILLLHFNTLVWRYGAAGQLARAVLKDIHFYLLRLCLLLGGINVIRVVVIIKLHHLLLALIQNILVPLEIEIFTVTAIVWIVGAISLLRPDIAPSGVDSRILPGDRKLLGERVGGLLALRRVKKLFLRLFVSVVLQQALKNCFFDILLPRAGAERVTRHLLLLLLLPKLVLVRVKERLLPARLLHQGLLVVGL